jgi:hypothetical protein
MYIPNKPNSNVLTNWKHNVVSLKAQLAQREDTIAALQAGYNLQGMRDMLTGTFMCCGECMVAYEYVQEYGIQKSAA